MVRGAICRHASAIAWMLWPGEFELPVLADHELRAILQRLRRYEYAWEKEISAKSSDVAKLVSEKKGPGRPKFVSLKMIFDIVCIELRYNHLLGLFPAYRHKSSLRKAKLKTRALRKRLKQEDSVNEVPAPSRLLLINQQH
jgi:hypothetical protein